MLEERKIVSSRPAGAKRPSHYNKVYFFFHLMSESTSLIKQIDKYLFDLLKIGIMRLVTVVEPMRPFRSEAFFS